MAGISTSIKVRDMATKVLNKMISAYQRMDRAAQAVDRTTESMDPGKPFDRAKPDIDKAKKSVEDFNRKQQEAENGAQKVKSAWSGVGGLVKSALAAFGLKEGIELTLGGALNLDSMEREFQARLGSDEMGTALFQKLQKQAQESAFGLEALAQNTSSFLAMTTNSEQLDGLNQIAQQLALFDKTGQGLEGAGFSLKEAMSGDIVSLAERFNISKAQIREFGIDQLGKQGDIDGFIKQFQKLLEAQNMGEKAYQKMLKSPKTQLNMFLSNIKTGFANAGRSALESLAPLIEKLNEWFASDQAQKFFQAVEFGLNAIAEGILWIWNRVQDFCRFVSDNLDWIIPILIAIATVYFVLMIKKLWAMIAPILIQLAAWSIMNWKILLIIAVIALLLIIVMACGATMEDVFGFIGGLLGSLFAIGWNLIANWWNGFAIFAEFLANVFIDPLNTIGRLFGQLGDWVLGVLSNLAGVIDAIFGSSFQNTVESWRKNLREQTERSYGEAKIKIPRIEQMNVKDTRDAWASGGRNFANWITDGIDTLQNLDFDSQNNWYQEPNIENVDNIGGDVNIADEDLQFLRDVAEMRFVQNFVTLTPTVAVDAKISERVDMDEVVHRIETQLENEFTIAAEGVYA